MSYFEFSDFYEWRITDLKMAALLNGRRQSGLIPVPRQFTEAEVTTKYVKFIKVALKPVAVWIELVF